MSNQFLGKTLLITGGTGSFGNAVLRRFLDMEVREIRIFSRDEKKQEDMRLTFAESKVKYYIGDVRELDSVASAMGGVDFVFHAAALKQVPSCEFYPLEAFRTNTIGGSNVMSAAEAAGVAKVIVLSTDKAVYPVNAMGMSKAMMEKIMVARARLASKSPTVLCGTRYGNVMGSRGSVIPLFISLIKGGLPLTVTDPKMTRFMMSMDDAIDLVMYAFSYAHSGDIFVQKAPAVELGKLAEALKMVFKAANPIKIIGTRHGEKLHETLLTREEMAKANDLGEYFQIAPDARDLNYDLYFTDGEERISRKEDYNSQNARILNVEEMADLLLRQEFVRQELKSWPS